ncbi:MAG: D-alanyl-D-alanine carboxypeptidase [Clostridia bacterium]|nr:D-alanyl-D-alanine carboxypeptidase [Clostridia bacterium]
MKKLCILFLIIFLIGIIPINTFAISARSAVVLDAASGRILFEHNSRERRGMASTTKIMTALCALEYGDMEKIVTISKTASGVEGSSMYLAPNEKLRLSDLVYGLMLVSGNDAATAIAESISGSTQKFAELMNKKALEIGAFDTSFTNPHGLSDENHFTTAYDLAKITAYAIKNPLFRDIVATKSKSLPQTEGGFPRHLVNHNKFLSMYDGCIGVKTGFTKATGRCLVTAVEKNGLKLICVTLNDPDDWSDHKNLFDSAYSTFTPHKVKSSNEVITTAPLKNGEVDKVDLIVPNDIYIPIKQGEESLIKISAEPFEELTAPVSAGDVLGTLKVKINDTNCGEFPLIANADIAERKAIFKTSKTGFGKTFKKLFYAWITCFE